MTNLNKKLKKQREELKKDWEDFLERKANRDKAFGRDEPSANFIAHGIFNWWVNKFKNTQTQTLKAVTELIDERIEERKLELNSLENYIDDEKWKVIRRGWSSISGSDEQVEEMARNMIDTLNDKIQELKSLKNNLKEILGR